MRGVPSAAILPIRNFPRGIRSTDSGTRAPAAARRSSRTGSFGSTTQMLAIPAPRCCTMAFAHASRARERLSLRVRAPPTSAVDAARRARSACPLSRCVISNRRSSLARASSAVLLGNRVSRAPA